MPVNHNIACSVAGKSPCWRQPLLAKSGCADLVSIATLAGMLGHSRWLGERFRLPVACAPVGVDAGLN